MCLWSSGLFLHFLLYTWSTKIGVATARSQLIVLNVTGGPVNIQQTEATQIRNTGPGGNQNVNLGNDQSVVVHWVQGSPNQPNVPNNPDQSEGPLAPDITEDEPGQTNTTQPVTQSTRNKTDSSRNTTSSPPETTTPKKQAPVVPIVGGVLGGLGALAAAAAGHHYYKKWKKKKAAEAEDAGEEGG